MNSTTLQSLRRRFRRVWYGLLARLDVLVVVRWWQLRDWLTTDDGLELERARRRQRPAPLCERLEPRWLFSSGIVEYTIPTLNSGPIRIAKGPDGNMWFTENSAGKIGKVSTTGSFTEYSLPAGQQPWGIVSGPGGNLWFTADAPMGGDVGTISTSGSVSESTLPGTMSQPHGLAVGGDGNVYVADSGNHSIDCVPAGGGTITVYTVPSSGQPQDIVGAPDGDLWFTEPGQGAIGRMTTGGSFTTFSVGTPGAGPVDLCVGSDGNLWFTDPGQGTVGRITLAGTVTTWSVGSSPPPGIGLGPDGNVWFADSSLNLDRITPAGTITAVASVSAPTEGFAIGPDRLLWFTEDGNAIAKLTGVQSATVAAGDPQQGAGVPVSGPGVGSGTDGVAPSGSLDASLLVIDPNTGNVRTGIPLDPFEAHTAPLACGCSLDDSPLMGVPFALMYNEDTAYVQPIIETLFTVDPGSGVPTTLQAQLTWNGTAEGWVSFSTSGHAAGDTYELALEAPQVTSGGDYPWSVEVQATLPGGGTLDLTEGDTAHLVVNGSSAAFGAGWSLAGQDQLVVGSSSVLFVAGSGGTRYFQSLGSGAFRSPPNDFGSLVQNGDGSYTYTAKGGLKENFTSTGQLTSLVDTHGLALTFVYSGGNLSNLDTPDGGVTTFSYSNSHLSQVQEPGNRALTVSYSGAGDLTAATLPDGSLMTFAYDSLHRLTNEEWGPLNTTLAYDSSNNMLKTVDRGGGSTLGIVPASVQGLATSPAIDQGQAVGVFTDGLNQHTTFTLDPLGRLLALATPDGATQSWQRDFAGQATAATDGLGRTTTMGYLYGAGDGDLAQVTNPDGSTEKFQYENTFHHLTQEQDTRGNYTTFTYDSTTGDLLTVKDALGDTTTIAWSQGLRQTETNPLGHTTTYQWDGNRHLTDTVDALGNRSTFGYDAAGNQTTSKDARGFTTTMSYDGERRLLQEQLPTGGSWVYGYDGIGDVTFLGNPNGHSIFYGYDSHGWRTTETQAPDTFYQQTTTMAYDVLGRETAFTNGLGNTSTFTYDPLGRLKTETNPVGAVTSYSYDLAGELTATTDGRGNTTTYSYDLRGRQAQTADALGNLATTVYDTEGNVTVSIDERGDRTTYGYDALDRQTQAQDAAGGIATTIYDAAGNISATIDARGNRTTYSYDSLNRETQLQDALGNFTTTLYDADGNATTTIDPRGYRTTYSYDGSNRQTQVQDAAGGYSTTLYDRLGNVTATITPLGNRSSTLYDMMERMYSVADAAGGIVTYSYDLANNVTTTKDQRGYTTTFSYDPDNRLTQTQDADGGLSTVQYDLADNVTVRVDQVGNRSTYSYDALNRQTNNEDPLGFMVTTAYDPAGNLTAITNARGFTTTYSYDGLNRQTQVQDAQGNLSTTQYDLAGNVTDSIDARGNRVSYAYDGLNRLTAQTDEVNHTTTTTYDKDGNVSTVTDPAGFTTTYSYDSLDRQTSVQAADKGITTTVYDLDGNVVNTIDPLNHKSTYSYDPLDRQTLAVNPDGAKTTTVYDAVGNTVNIIDADGNKTTFIYDPMNRLTQATDALGRSATFAYDLAGRRTSATDRDGRVIATTYDAEGRETGQTWTASGSTTNILTFTYDGNGNQLTAANFAGTYTMSYDSLDRLSATQEPFGQALTAAYDPVGNRTQVQDSQGGTTTSVYDAANRLTTRETSGQAAIREDFSYTPRNELATETRYSNLAGTTKVGSVTFGYDQVGRVTHLQHLGPNGGNAANYTYTYDLAGNVKTEKLNGANPTTYVYDAANQLTNDTAKSYSYDLTGNRTMSGYTTGTGNQLLNNGVYTYTYDNEGNLIEKSKGTSSDTWRYSYDNANRLVAVSDAPSTTGAPTMTATYSYDAFGNRVEKDYWQGGAVTVTRYAYDGQEVWATLNGSNQLQTRYLLGQGMGAPLARISSGGTVAWYLTDRLGSVRNLTDNNGTLQDTIAYDGYGKKTSESNTSFGDQYKYAGYFFDSETSLYTTLWRYYDPTIGRWISQDPLGFDAGDPNLYRYVANNPTDFTDPEGLIRGQGSYSNCNCVGWKELKVQVAVLFGSRAWSNPAVVAADFKQANAIYAQCCVRVIEVGLVKWNRRRTEAVTGGPPFTLVTYFNLGKPPRQSNLTNAEVALTRNQTKGSGLVYAYYVHGFSQGGVLRTLGYSFSADTYKTPPAPSVILSDDTSVVQRGTTDQGIMRSGNVFSHELGHVLLQNGGAHVPLRELGIGSEPNLMSDNPNQAWVLVQVQCDRIRKSPLVTWELFPPELQGLR